MVFTPSRNHGKIKKGDIVKLKILVKIVEKLLGMNDHGNEHRADMYLPDKLLALALVLLAIGTACGIFAVIQFALWAVVCAALGLILGLFALLCWRNQAIHMISSEKFTYTTMFGNTYTFSFSEIEGLLQNTDSMTLLVAGKKVHIESMAIITDRLADRINQVLREISR
jgi:hypothetical protein